MKVKADVLDFVVAKQEIDALDFTAVIGKLVSQHGWSRQHAMEVSDLYRKFLFLKKKYGDIYRIPPSEDIDDFWHMHILDTEKYSQETHRIFNCYLHHYPYFGMDDLSGPSDQELAFTETQELFVLEFGGEGVYRVRGFFAKLGSFFRRRWFC
jgi:hypothetical protein